MKKALQVALGIVTSVGGYLEIGSVTTAVQGGAAFRFQLLWAIALGTLCLIFLVEMSGRLAAVSKHTLIEAIRERFGFPFFSLVLVVVSLVTLAVLASEIGGVSLAIQMATGISYPWWAIVVAFLVWLTLWKGTFGIIENGVSLLGLVTVVFLVGAVKLHPSWHQVGAGLLPSLPRNDRTHYWFIAVSILGACITPYLFIFYSAGAVEDKWDDSYLGVNRATATLGMTFGGVLSAAVLVVAAMVFPPRGIQIDQVEQLPLMLTTSLGRWGFILFVLSLGIACLGAALEIGLALAYLMAQGFGWNWGEDEKESNAARFSLTYTVAVLIAALPIALGVDPLKLTVLTMAITAASLPFMVVPFLFLMNDEEYLGEHTNGWLSNSVVIFAIALAFVLAVVSIPLEIFGS
ncbi:MAG: divalent metal cation transporter [Gemmatimonadota bacterium]|nr:divalent metal cation transporter [Gemmatimonadota bacterium]